MFIVFLANPVSLYFGSMHPKEAYFETSRGAIRSDYTE